MLRGHILMGCKNILYYVSDCLLYISYRSWDLEPIYLNGLGLNTHYIALLSILSYIWGLYEAASRHYNDIRA